MARSESISGTDSCSLQRRWLLDPTLATALVEAEIVAQGIFAAEGVRWPGIFIISGHRTAAAQKEVNPSQPSSHHRCCPSLAVDLRVGDLPASITPRQFFKFIADLLGVRGIRWGGDFPGELQAQLEQNHYYLQGRKCNT